MRYKIRDICQFPFIGGLHPRAISGLIVRRYSLHTLSPPESLLGSKLQIPVYRAAVGCKLTIENFGVAKGDIFLNHFRRKYHNCQLSIIHCQFVRQHAKWQFIGPCPADAGHRIHHSGYRLCWPKTPCATPDPLYPPVLPSAKHSLPQHFPNTDGNDPPAEGR